MAFHANGNIPAIRSILLRIVCKQFNILRSEALTGASGGAILTVGYICFELKHLIRADGMDYEEAAEFIDFNTLGALPSMGENAPIVLMEIEG